MAARRQVASKREHTPSFRIHREKSEIADRTYGVCMTCGNLIDKNRLIHSPFVKTCTGCQRTLENEANERR